jgi:hypothetical protein
MPPNNTNNSSFTVTGEASAYLNGNYNVQHTGEYGAPYYIKAAFVDANSWIGHWSSFSLTSDVI